MCALPVGSARTGWWGGGYVLRGPDATLCLTWWISLHVIPHPTRRCWYARPIAAGGPPRTAGRAPDQSCSAGRIQGRAPRGNRGIHPSGAGRGDVVCGVGEGTSRPDQNVRDVFRSGRVSGAPEHAALREV